MGHTDLLTDGHSDYYTESTKRYSSAFGRGSWNFTYWHTLKTKVLKNTLFVNDMLSFEAIMGLWCPLISKNFMCQEAQKSKTPHLCKRWGNIVCNFFLRTGSAIRQRSIQSAYWKKSMFCNLYYKPAVGLPLLWRNV